VGVPGSLVGVGSDVGQEEVPVALVAVFGGVLVVATLISGLAERSVVSTSVLFLALGVVVGPSVLGLVHLSTSNPTVGEVASVALGTVVFVDAMDAPARLLADKASDVVRTLVVGMPLVAGVVALVAHLVLGLGWLVAFALGAVLAPTDPVLASAMVVNDRVPARLRHLLNVESGLNDGLALPAVLALLAVARAPGGAGLPIALGEVAEGIGIGVAAAGVAFGLRRWSRLHPSPRLAGLEALALGIGVFGLTESLGANPYLALFAAGATVATLDAEARSRFGDLGTGLVELVKFAALVVVGVLLTPTFLSGLRAGVWLVAAVALVVARPLAIGVALVGTSLGRAERAAVAWFGPKGFASLAFGLLLLHSGLPGAHRAWEAVLVTIICSVVAHSTTDAAVARAVSTRRASPELRTEE